MAEGTSRFTHDCLLTAENEPLNVAPLQNDLAPGGFAVSLQNSINEDAIAHAVGWGRTIGCSTRPSTRSLCKQTTNATHSNERGGSGMTARSPIAAPGLPTNPSPRSKALHRRQPSPREILCGTSGTETGAFR